MTQEGDRAGVIDWHMHIWLPEQLGEWSHLLPENFAARGSPEQFERAFDESGIGTAVIVALVSRQLDLEVPNQFIADQVAKDPKRRIGVASVDPNDPDALDELSRAADLGLRGVKLSPPYQGFHPHAPEAWAIYEAAARRGMFLLFHQGWVFDPRCSLEEANPILLDRVAGAFPETNIIIAHLGQPWFWETISVMVRRSNVFTDVSARLTKPWQLSNALMAAMDYGVEDRILFGSDFPIVTPDEGIQLLLGLNDSFNGVPPLPQQLLRDIVWKRPLSLLDL